MPNETMRDLWTKHGGPAWIAKNQLFESVYAPFNDAVADALEPLAGRTVLDVGCGPGSLSGVITARGGDAVGIDISEPMIDGARELVPGARFEVADAQTDDLAALGPAGGFDAVASRFGVMFFEDPVAAFENIRAGGQAGRTDGVRVLAHRGGEPDVHARLRRLAGSPALAAAGRAGWCARADGVRRP